MMKRLVLAVAVIAAFACIAECAIVAEDSEVAKQTVVVEGQAVSPCVFGQSAFGACVSTTPKAFVRKYRQSRAWLPRIWAAPCVTCVPQAQTAVYEVTEKPQKPWVNRGVLRDRVVIPKRPSVIVERVQ